MVEALYATTPLPPGATTEEIVSQISDAIAARAFQGNAVTVKAIRAYATGFVHDKLEEAYLNISTQVLSPWKNALTAKDGASLAKIFAEKGLQWNNMETTLKHQKDGIIVNDVSIEMGVDQSSTYVQSFQSVENVELMVRHIELPTPTTAITTSAHTLFSFSF